MKKRPIGVTVVAVVTLLAAFAFGFSQAVVIGLSAAGGPPSSPSGFPRALLFLSAVAVLVFGLSMGQLGGAQWAWYGSIVFWMLCLIGFGWFACVVDFSQGIIFLDQWGYLAWYGLIEFLLTLIPLVYAAGCTRYFLTRNVRNYFLNESP